MNFFNSRIIAIKNGNLKYGHQSKRRYRSKGLGHLLKKSRTRELTSSKQFKKKPRRMKKIKKTIKNLTANNINIYLPRKTQKTAKTISRQAKRKQEEHLPEKKNLNE